MNSFPEIAPVKIIPLLGGYLIYSADITRNRPVAHRFDPPDYQPPGAVCQLWHEDLGQTEPIVDRLRWLQDGVLSMLIQRTTQPKLMAEHDVAPEVVRIVDWRLPDVRAVRAT